MKIKVSKEFSRTPGPRYVEEGDCSGEVFRTKILWPKVQETILKGLPLEIDLDGTAGYGTSFLEEAFGGLIRHHDMTLTQVNKITIISKEEPYLLEDIEEYLRDAQAKKKA